MLTTNYQNSLADLTPPPLREMDIPRGRDRTHGEGLVELPDVDVLVLQAGLLQDARRGVGRSVGGTHGGGTSDSEERVRSDSRLETVQSTAHPLAEAYQSGFVCQMFMLKLRTTVSYDSSSVCEVPLMCLLPHFH